MAYRKLDYPVEPGYHWLYKVANENPVLAKVAVVKFPSNDYTAYYTTNGEAEDSLRNYTYVPDNNGWKWVGPVIVPQNPHNNEENT